MRPFHLIASCSAIVVAALTGCGSKGGDSQRVVIDQAATIQSLDNVIAVYDQFNKTEAQPADGYELVKYVKANNLRVDKDGYIEVERDRVGDGDIAAGIFRSKETDTVMIAYRGTQTVMESIQDLRFRLTDFVNYHGEVVPGDVQVSTGFYNFYASMRQEIFSYIEETNPTEIIVTGHSLGAVTAVYTAFDLIDSFNRKVRLMPFATPRAGNDAMTEAMANQARNAKLLPTIVQNVKDQVTWLPPKFASYTSFPKGSVYELCFYKEGEKHNVGENHDYLHYKAILMDQFGMAPKPDNLVICNP